MKVISFIIMVFLILGSGVVFSSEQKGSQYAVSEATPKYDKEAVQGAMLNLIHDNGDTIVVDDKEATFDYLHDGVKEKDGYYISCADFNAGDNVYDIDYYVKDRNGVYVVERVVYHKKNGEEVNKYLWEKVALKGMIENH